AVRTWDAGTGKLIAPEAPVRLAPTSSGRGGFSPDGRRFLEFMRRGGAWELRLWDTTTGRPVILSVKLGLGGGARSTPDGRRPPPSGPPPRPPAEERGGAPGEAQIWDTTTGRPLTPPLRHFGEVYQAEFTPDGRRVVTASLDRT